MIEDWELGVLFLKETERLGSEKDAIESVKNTFLNRIFRKDKDTHFFMGTCFPRNTMGGRWGILSAAYRS